MTYKIILVDTTDDDYLVQHTLPGTCTLELGKRAIEVLNTVLSNSTHEYRLEPVDPNKVEKCG